MLCGAVGAARTACSKQHNLTRWSVLKSNAIDLSSEWFGAAVWIGDAQLLITV